MNNQEKQLFGSWIQAVGTVMNAVGSTPSDKINEEQQDDLNLWGNVLQAVGNALIADGTEMISLNKLGNEVQAIGNTTVVGGILLDFQEKTKKSLIIKGNLLQAVGGGMAIADTLEEEPSLEKALNVIGDLLQVIGNSLQVIAGINELQRDTEKDDGEDKQESDNESKQESMEQINYFRKNSSEKKQEDKEGDPLDITGSWIQAVGSVISAIVQTRSSQDESNLS
ncbi:DUF6944 family repetitive protein [Cytobacillus sp. FJAT-53684]|uniref:DUF6944 family repetitive protein n=1 Tax=Cytobacillus mangrovibacter TaxID=3299024 RepID=A0ABW6K454_9BACI